MGSRRGEEEPSALFEEEENDPSLASSSEKVGASATRKHQAGSQFSRTHPFVQSSLAWCAFLHLHQGLQLPNRTEIPISSHPLPKEGIPQYLFQRTNERTLLSSRLRQNRVALTSVAPQDWFKESESLFWMSSSVILLCKIVDDPSM